MSDDGFDESIYQETPKIPSFPEIHLPEPLPLRTDKQDPIMRKGRRITRRDSTTLVYEKKEQNGTNRFSNGIGMFDSNFQSGNLYQVYRVSNDEYDLVLQRDSNTVGYSQWFYFHVNNPELTECTFNIVNMTKAYDLLPIHDLGIKVKVDSSWRTLKGISICYSEFDGEEVYCLSFKAEGWRSYYVALSVPYLTDELSHLETFCSTSNGTLVKYLQMGDRRKDVLMVIARQHPGETCSSHVCQGLMKAMEKSQLLVDYHVIIFPMINPDGVQLGNFRCDTTGVDLNRIWNNPGSHKQITAIKELITSLVHAGKDIKFFIDLHGHSKKLNSFIYGCRDKINPVSCRVFPAIMQKVSQYFRLDDCTFYIAPYKQKTARGTIFKMLGPSYHNVLTLETSLFGYQKEDRVHQFEISDYHRIGEDVVKAIEIYFKDKDLVEDIQNALLIKLEDLNKQDSVLDDLSDSDPERGLVKKKKKKRTGTLSPQQMRQTQHTSGQNTFHRTNNHAFQLKQSLKTVEIDRSTTNAQPNKQKTKPQLKLQWVNHDRSVSIHNQTIQSPRTKIPEAKNSKKKQIDLLKFDHITLEPPKGAFRQYRTQINDELSDEAMTKYYQKRAQVMPGFSPLKPLTRKNVIRYKSVIPSVSECEQKIRQIRYDYSQDHRLIFEQYGRVKRKNTQL